MADGQGLAAVFALLTGVFWSVNAVLMRKGVVRALPIHGALVTSLVGIPVMILISLILGDFHFLLEMSLGSALVAALAGLVGQALARWLWYSGIKLIGAARASSLDNSSILFSTLSAIVLLHETLTLKLGLAIIAIFIGVYLITKGESAKHAEGRLATSRERNIGLIAGLSAAALFGVGNVINKVAVASIGSPVIAYLIATTSASMVIGVATLSTRNIGALVRLRHSDLGTLSVAGFAHSLGTLSQYAALFLAPVVFVTPIIRIYPLFTIAISLILLQRVERVNGYVVIGAIITLLGIYDIFT